MEINTNKIAWRIFKKLEDCGAGIGNASVIIIEKELSDALLEQNTEGEKEFFTKSENLEERDNV